mgnify:CR=1 FL=1
MTNRKSTKRALLGSVMAMVLCLAMLVGATFAWFTDTASTGVNKIQAGNLDVQLVDENGNSLEGKTLEFKKAANAAEGEAVLWEPGCTYELPAVYVKNNGKLALKYKVAITGINGSAKLNEAIEWTIGDVAMGAEQHLKAGESNEFTIKGHMKESAGNEYMDLTISGISITVYATQDTVESDSFNNTYDANATYPVVNVTELKEALTNGGVVAVTEDIQTNNIEDTAAARIVISQPTTLNLEKKIITPDNMGNNGTNFCALIVDADTTINAGENGGIDTGVNGGYGINVRKGATVTINDGYYYGGGTAVQVQEGTLVINGGTFACEPFGDPYGYNFLINCVDSAYKNGTAKVIINGGDFRQVSVPADDPVCDLIYALGNATIEINGGTFKAVTPANTLNCKDGSNAKITVKGGSFYKYDPSNPTMGDNEVVVAAGYHVEQNGDWFNVVAD